LALNSKGSNKICNKQVKLFSNNLPLAEFQSFERIFLMAIDEANSKLYELPPVIFNQALRK
jgi:hypothetical protein